MARRAPRRTTAAPWGVRAKSVLRAFFASGSGGTRPRRCRGGLSPRDQNGPSGDAHRLPLGAHSNAVTATFTLLGARGIAYDCRARFASALISVIIHLISHPPRSSRPSSGRVRPSRTENDSVRVRVGIWTMVINECGGGLSASRQHIT